MAHEIAARRGLALDWSARFEHPATAMDGSLTAMLTRAVERTGVPATTISSGAGHDAMIVAAHMPAAMLFIRTPGGVSHHPDESVTEEDVTAALAAGGTFLDEMASAAGG
jgi:allantoate deiminase